MNQLKKLRLEQMIEGLVNQDGLPEGSTKKIYATFLRWHKELMGGKSFDTLDEACKNKLSNVQHIFFDFDGVLTDNKVYTDQHGNESVCCDRADGIGIKQLKSLGKQVYVLSTEANPVVQRRTEKLNIECFNACNDKAEFMKTWLKENDIPSIQVAFVGNDINDLGVMKEVGISLCPADSESDVMAFADIILERSGGDKVVREVASLAENAALYALDEAGR